MLLPYVSQLLKLKMMSLKEAEREKPIIPFLWCSVLYILEPNVDQVVLVVKNLPASAEDVRNLVRSLGQEDPLEEVMATYSSNLTWRIPWTEEPGRLLSMGSQRVGHDWVTNTFTFTLKVAPIQEHWVIHPAQMRENLLSWCWAVLSQLTSRHST